MSHPDFKATLSIRLSTRHRRGGGSHLYRVAGHWLVTDEEIPELTAFGSSEATAMALVPPPLPAVRGGWERIFEGEGWVGGRRRQVRCLSCERGFWIEVCGVGHFLVDHEGRSVRCLWRSGGRPEELRQAVLGPCLCLALALRGTFCLQASAVLLPHGLAVLIGDVGVGTSTLAAHLAEAHGEARRVADDVLPVRRFGDGWQAMPAFPQLELGRGEQWTGAPETMSVRGIYRLQRAAGTSRTAAPTVVIEPLRDADASLALVRHTIAARLFHRPLLRRHFDFCTGLRAAVPVRALTFRPSHHSLPEVTGALAADLRPPSRPSSFLVEPSLPLAAVGQL